jgi:hypothetical protein
VFLARAPNHVLGGRDLESPDRVLVVLPHVAPAGAAPGGPEALAELDALVETLVDAMPGARVTVALGHPGPTGVAERADAWRGAGVEVEDVTEWGQWLVDRRCHYSLVVTRSGTAVAGAARDAQPAATFATPGELRALGREQLARWLLERGFSSAARADAPAPVS